MAVFHGEDRDGQRLSQQESAAMPVYVTLQVFLGAALLMWGA